MSFALQPTSIIPVKVVGDWSDANIVADDIIVALEASFPGVFYFPLTDNILISLIRPLVAGSDKGSYTIDATTGNGSASTAFSAAPSVGEIVYIIDMY